MKNLILVFLSLIPFLLNAQSEDKFILRGSFGYNYNHKDGIDSDNLDTYYRLFSEVNNDLNFSINAGRKLKSNFYYGLGIDYTFSKQEFNPDKDVPELKPPSSLGFYSYSSYQNSISKSNTISPNIYLQYYTSLTERLAIAVQFYSKYDFYAEEQRSIYYMPSNFYNPFPEEYKYLKSDEHMLRNERQYLNFGLQPSVRYKVYKNIGLELSFGAIRYQLKTKDSRLQNMVKMPSEFEMKFKPENWKFGFYMTL